VTYSVGSQFSAVTDAPRDHADIKDKVRSYIAENFLFGSAQDLQDGASLLDAGILDSTGAMELVAFLGQRFGISVADEELVPDNLDSVERISAYVGRKLNVA